VSNALRSWYVDAFPVDPSRVVCLPNGVATPNPTSAAERDAIRRDLGIRPDALMATMVGIMRPDKGHEQLLGAAHAMSSPSDVQFAMLGDGPLRKELEQQAERLQLGPDRVVFAGFREDVAEVLGASDLLVHPTLDDALPTALLHGLAAGLPIVASDTGGIPEIVTPTTGILVPPGNVGALVDGLEQLVAQLPAPEMARAARTRFDQEFDSKIWATRLRGLYEEIISETRN
jgi:glycosyltransferase involved in cell wall biosynthesis